METHRTTCPARERLPVVRQGNKNRLCSGRKPLEGEEACRGGDVSRVGTDRQRTGIVRLLSNLSAQRFLGGIRKGRDLKTKMGCPAPERVDLAHLRLGF